MTMLQMDADRPARASLGLSSSHVEWSLCCFLHAPWLVLFDVHVQSKLGVSAKEFDKWEFMFVPGGRAALVPLGDSDLVGEMFKVGSLCSVAYYWSLCSIACHWSLCSIACLFVGVQSSPH